ncbi:MAG: hypothetical protein PHV34_23140 [Verrucomicrobiae bacterium]|nr:hypothetical protein [Verrucomicrobiae bacterium]
MNVDAILLTLNRHEVEYLLIGGVNFLLRHDPVLTFDIDIWIEDSPANRQRLNGTLVEMEAQWGATEKEWKAVARDAGWLERQSVFCLTTRYGALDVFRSVKGLEGRYAECLRMAVPAKTATGIPYRGLSDPHMLECQLALDETGRKPERIRRLRESLGQVQSQGGGHRGGV